MTIIKAITEVIKRENKPLTHQEIYSLIVKQNLYEFKAQDPLNIVRIMIRRHCYGLKFPSSNKTKYFKVLIDKENISRYIILDDSKILINKIVESDSDKLPEEIIYKALLNHKENVKTELLETILSSTPDFFETLVVELLLKMGYGWDKQESGYVNGKTGDGGIDGIIYEDKLGLGKIYIQAKRYSKKTIGRPDVQQFVGAMEHNLKGVYISTSSFTKQAKDYIEKQSKDIVLIDGQKLVSLLIDNHLGIQKVQTFSIYEIDKNYFQENSE